MFYEVTLTKTICVAVEAETVDEAERMAQDAAEFECDWWTDDPDCEVDFTNEIDKDDYESADYKA